MSLLAWDPLAERVNADGEFGVAGHFPMCEDPERFFDAIRPVLEKLRASS